MTHFLNSASVLLCQNYTQLCSLLKSHLLHFLTNLSLALSPANPLSFFFHISLMLLGTLLNVTNLSETEVAHSEDPIFISILIVKGAQLLN